MPEQTMKPIRFKLSELRADLLGIQKRLVKAHNGFFRYQVLHRVFTVLANAEYNYHVFIGNVGNYQRSLQHHNLALTIGYGLITSDGEVWRRQRKLTQPAFDKELLVRVVEITTKLTQDMLATWQQASQRNEPVDVFNEMQNLTMRVIGLALFSIDLKDTPNHFPDTVRVALELAMMRNISPIILPLWLPTKLHRRHHHLVSEVDKFVYALIDQRLKNNEGYTDILGKLIRSYGEDAQRYRHELRDQIVTLFFAGFETTGSALTWIWYLLSQNLKHEALLHEELASVLGGRAPTYDDMDNLRYSYQVLEESMRLYPPVYTLTRKAVEADVVGGCPIEKDANVLVPIHAIHRMPEYWESPDDFCPERFAPEAMTEAQHKAYMPFAAGQRKCMGVNFATLEMLTVLSIVGQQVRLRLVEGHEVVIQPAVTIYPKYGLKMRVESR